MRRWTAGRLGRLGGGAALVAAATLAMAPAAGATTTVMHVKIVSSSSTCTSEFCFKPRRLKISPGVRVSWFNSTTVGHTVTRCTPAACGGVSGGTGTDSWPGSGIIGPGTHYGFTFHGAGTYVYYCQIHGYAVMHGTINVT